MKLTFNIATKIDITKLNREINCWVEDNPNDSPIIILNKETLEALPVNLVYVDYKGGCGNLKYHGNRVFIDSEKSFGEIELR